MVKALAGMARDGDREAFEKLAAVFWGDIHRMIYYRTNSAMDADDLVQDIFLKAYRNLPGLKDPGRFKAWLYSIAMNRLKDHYRKKTVMSILRPRGGDDEPDALAEAADERPGALDGAMKQQFWGLVRSFTQELPKREREVFLLRYFDQLAVSEIAQAMGSSQSAVKTHLHRAVKKLRGKPKLLDALRGEI